MNGPLEEEMRGMIVCDKVCRVWCGLLVSSPVTRVNLPWLMKLPRRGFMTIEFLLEDLADKGISEKASSCIYCFQMPTAQNNQYTKAAKFGAGTS